MESLSMMGGLVPLWILCAPLLLAVVALAGARKHHSRDEERNVRVPQAPAYAQPVTGLGAQRV